MSLLFVNTNEGKGQLIDLHTKSIVCSYNTGNSYRYACCYCPHIHLIALHHIRRCAFFLSPHHQQVVQRSFTTSVITSCAITQCGTFMIAGSDSGHLFVWNVRTGELIKNCKAHLRAVTCIAFSFVDNNALVATSSADAECKVWTLASLVQPHRGSSSKTNTAPQHSKNVTNSVNVNDSHSYDFSNNNNNNTGDDTVYSSINMEQPIEVDAGAITPLSICTTHTLSVEVCAFMHQANYVWTGSSDKTCRVFDAVTGHVLYTWTVGESVSAIAITDDDAYCVIGTTKGTIFIRSLTSTPHEHVKLSLTASTSLSKSFPSQYYYSDVGNEPHRTSTNSHWHTSNTSNDMAEPIVIPPCADGHHSSIVHLSFVRSIADKIHNHSINTTGITGSNDDINSTFSECAKVLSVNENGSVLIHDILNGKLSGDKISLPRMKIASCCIVPQRNATNLLRKETELKKTFKGLSKNSLNLAGGSNGFNDMTLIETLQVLRVHGNISSAMKEHIQGTCNKHHVSSNNEIEWFLQGSDQREQNQKLEEVEEKQQVQELEQLTRENTELEELKQKLQLKLRKALKRTRPLNQSVQ